MSARSYIQPYVCEISSKENRGLNSSLWMIFFCGGIFTITLLGAIILETNYFPHWYWRFALSSLALISVICLLGMLFIYESPEWLLQTGLTEEALLAWKFYNPGGTELGFQSYADTVKQESSMKQ